VKVWVWLYEGGSDHSSSNSSSGDGTEADISTEICSSSLEASETGLPADVASSDHDPWDAVCSKSSSSSDSLARQLLQDRRRRSSNKSRGRPTTLFGKHGATATEGGSSSSSGDLAGSCCTLVFSLVHIAMPVLHMHFGHLKQHACVNVKLS
jgi:hypothetical protein